MLKKIKNWLKPVVHVANNNESNAGVFSSDALADLSGVKKLTLQDINALAFQKTVADFAIKNGDATMDAGIAFTKQAFAVNQTTLNPLQFGWFALQSFIGYQACAILAQHPLIDKVCTVPAQDASRNGFKVTKNDGEKIEPDVLNAIVKANEKFNLNKNLVEFIKMGRVFGVRLAMFIVNLPNAKEFYENPFNIDAITPGSYQGISQIDPYWVMPELDQDATANPESIYFYEPTWWRISSARFGSLRVHRTHLIIMRHAEVADVLKPTYFYGGVPLPQQIHDRVYCAERTADEAPKLALTKRSTIIKCNVDQALANQGKFEARMNLWAQFRDNYGIKIIGEKEEAQQFDTSLADLDAAIMTQYQLVAAIARMPVTKLLGTTAKGFNATGEFDEASYHEELESLQTTFLTPLVNRHLELLIRSKIAPDFKITPFEVEIEWENLDVMTAKEQAEVNKLDAEAGQLLVTSGAISPAEERQRVVSSPGSGYNGLSDNDLLDEPISPDEDTLADVTNGQSTNE